jgi:hypothetical protein
MNFRLTTLDSYAIYGNPGHPSVSYPVSRGRETKLSYLNHYRSLDLCSEWVCSEKVLDYARISNSTRGCSTHSMYNP